MGRLSGRYRKGLIWTASGTILASFEGLLVRLVSVDSWTVIVWRGALLGLTMLAVLVTTRRKLQTRSLGVLAFVAIFALAGTSLFFISAVTFEFHESTARSYSSPRSTSITGESSS